MDAENPVEQAPDLSLENTADDLGWDAFIADWSLRDEVLASFPWSREEFSRDESRTLSVAEASDRARGNSEEDLSGTIDALPV